MDEVWTAPARARGAVAVVDLDAIAHNVRRLRAAAPGAALMAVVKADGYGHGAAECARAARAAGAEWLATAYVEEAVALRDGGDEGPLLALVTGPGVDSAAAIAQDVDLSVSSPEVLAQVVAAAHALDRTARVHLEVDTGLSRGGATPGDWPALVRAAASSGAHVVGIWSHLACADEPGHPSIAMQCKRFDEALEVAAAEDVRPQLRHLANSAATLTLPESHYDLVRAGIAVYGVTPGHASTAELGLRAAMSLRARLALTKRVSAGEGVSYGHTYVTDRDTVLGLVPLGYGDGVPRAASGTGPVRVGSVRTTVAGRVCMDQFVVDLGPESTAVAGDEVVLFGDEAEGFPTAQDWGISSGSIGYEVVTRLGARVPRVYVGGAR